MCKSVILFVIALSFRFGLTKIAPAYITPCPGLKSDCIKKIAQEAIPEFVKGIPSLGLDVLDPMIQSKVDLQLPGGLNIHFSNGTVTGLRGCIVDSATYKDYKAEINMHCDIAIKGFYKANGQIILFSINGDGLALINTPNTILKGILHFEDRTRNGIVYHEVKKFIFEYKHGGQVSFDIDNLIKGNSHLSEAVLTFLNENWKTVSEEFGKPIVDAVVKVVIKNVKKFFKSVPKDELIIA